jgi:hypothetical protein
LHWPSLDEDLSIKGNLAGDYGQRRPKELHSTPARRP